MKQFSRLPLLSLLSASAMFGASIAAAPAYAQAKPNIVLGVVLPLTGVLAPYGKPNLEAITLAVEASMEGASSIHAPGFPPPPCSTPTTFFELPATRA